jgi:hypothetical protein
VLLRKRLTPYFSLFTRVRSAFANSRDRILEDSRDVRSEIGGSLSLERGGNLMGSASNEGDFSAALAQTLFQDKLFFAWGQSRPATGKEAEVATVFSYSDLLVKVQSFQ